MKLERLGNYIKQIRGLSYKPNEIHDEYQEGRIAILKANNIQDNVLDDTDLIYIDKSKTKTEQKIKKGDILIAASSGSKEIVGKNIYFRNDYEAVFGAFCKVVRINEKVNSEFISHFFKTPIYKNHIRNSIQGANINNLKNEHIDELKLAIPSLEEQKHIAAVLSKAEALIAERKQSIQLLDEYLKSTFLEMFGDPVENTKNYVKTALSNLLEVRGRVGWKGYKKSDLRMSGPYVLGATHLTHSGDIDLNDPVYISREKFEESPEIMVQIGDLLIVQRGNTIGKVGH
jgi:type I restriction enzyme S subunit